MKLHVFMNELSSTSIESELESELLAEKLWNLIYKIAGEAKNFVLVSDVPLYQLSADVRYPLARWLNSGDRREHLRFLRSIDQRSPFRSLSDFSNMEWQGVFESENCVGLGLAYLFQGLAISWALDRWNRSLIGIQILTLEEAEEDSMVLEQLVHVRHASEVAHLETHLSFLKELRAHRELPGDGDEMWKKKADNFPNLRFLPRVENQIRGLDSGSSWFRSIWNRLCELNGELEIWEPESGDLPEWKSLTTPESEQRLPLCQFVDLDGEKRYFEWHKRFTPGKGRLHFRLVEEQKVAIVAHVGAKL